MIKSHNIIVERDFFYNGRVVKASPAPWTVKTYEPIDMGADFLVGKKNVYDKMKESYFRTLIEQGIIKYYKSEKEIELEKKSLDVNTNKFDPDSEWSRKRAALYEALTVDQLKILSTEIGIEFTAKAKKLDIILMLVEHEFKTEELNYSDILESKNTDKAAENTENTENTETIENVEADGTDKTEE